MLTLSALVSRCGMGAALAGEAPEAAEAALRFGLAQVRRKKPEWEKPCFASVVAQGASSAGHSPI